MYIISTKNGEMVQFSNVDIGDTLNILASTWGDNLIYTTDEVICEKAEKLEWFGVIVENGQIVDVVEAEPATAIINTPTLEERIAALEMAMSFMLGM